MPPALVHLRAWLPCLAAALTAGCASWMPLSDDAPVATRMARLLPADVLLLGEQHDAADHHAIERQAVEALVRQGKLAALAIEMAEEGQGTAHLNESASEAQVQAALSWNDKAWAWADYGPVVMAAVQAGVPVLGANLPRERMKDAMADVSLDVQLADPELEAQRQAVRDGHCGLLPEAQIVPMTRVQIARDRAMAQSVMKARSPGKTVLLIAGAGHTTKTLGVAQHLPTDVRVKSVQLAAGRNQPAAGHDATWRTPALPAKDYCAKLKADRG